MPLMRNPFRNKDENVRVMTNGVDDGNTGLVASPTAITKDQKPAEYQLSGQFCPMRPMTDWVTRTRSEY